MDNYSARVAFDDPEMIPDYITGKQELMEATPEATVYHGEIAVCRIVGGELDAIACDHPKHGCHPRFREAYAKARELMAKLRSSGVDDGPCPKCDGTGWLATNSAEARHTVILSTMIGMWRGVAFTPRGLSAGNLGDTMGAFLSGLGPEGASSSPVGVAAPDRAIFSQRTGEDEGTGEGE